MSAKTLALVLVLISGVAPAAEFRGRVVKVTGGDMITVLDRNHRQHVVQLQGIDAPEPKQPFATIAQDVLGELVQAPDIVVEDQGQDPDGRTLGTVYVNDANGRRTNVNLTMVKMGLAWHDVQHDKTKSLADTEKMARAKKSGLWADANPTTPWVWRWQRDIFDAAQ